MSLIGATYSSVGRVIYRSVGGLWAAIPLKKNLSTTAKYL